LDRHAARVFVNAAAGLIVLGFKRSAIGDAVQPARERIGLANGGRVPRQHQKRGLERVLGVLFVVQHLPADPQDQGTVPLHQGSKRSLLAAGGKALQQLAVGQALDRFGSDQFLNVSDDCSQLSVRQIKYLVFAQTHYLLVPVATQTSLDFDPG
jgi:hypothetical protein